MKITRRDVEQIALLARLELGDEEVEALARDLGSILDHIRELEGVATEGVAATAGVAEHTTPMREDAPGADALYIPLEQLAPASEEGLFTVPRLAALDADAMGDEGGSA